MPALSPTMEAGTISEWKVKEGEAFAAGDSIAEIETDKATIDFEAQDDGIIAKILVEAGSTDIPVGVPVCVTVEEEEDVAAFKDFVPEVVETAVVEEKSPETAAPEPVPVVPEPVAVVEPVAVAEPVVAIAEPVAPVIPAVVDSPNVSSSESWGNFARVKSPLAALLSADQKKYVEKYGSTGQVPL
jgi:pyruvate dehydrogenase E2 component (dihydrolipoamide acetyltransferase)